MPNSGILVLHLPQRPWTACGLDQPNFEDIVVQYPLLASAKRGCARFYFDAAAAGVRALQFAASFAQHLDGRGTGRTSQRFELWHDRRAV